MQELVKIVKLKVGEVNLSLDEKFNWSPGAEIDKVFEIIVEN